MTLPLLVAGVMLAALAIYALTGGADFGGGTWDLLARGERADALRRAIERALAPVWEANHVWLVFVVVLMFTAFPPAFARIGTELHIPLTLLLVGIVLRGSAFIFRQYGAGADHRRWGRVFAIASVGSTMFLGMVLGAMTTGGPWWGAFPIAVGVLALVAFAFLAAVYLAVEVADDPPLLVDVRRRVRWSGGATIVVAAAVAFIGSRDAPAFTADLVGSWWSIPLLGGATVAMVGALVASHRGRDRLARAGAIAAVGLLVLGWGLAHAPLVVAPDLTLANASAPPVTLKILLPVVLVGAVLLVPSLWWLMRVFKSR